MLNKIFTTFIVIICLFSIQCSSSKKLDTKYNNKILGSWERVGDRSAGLIVKVVQLSNEDNYIGKVVMVPESAREFDINDMIWQNVKGTNSSQWTGNVLHKRETLLSGAVGQTYNAKFLLVNDNLMEVYVNNNTQKWIRSK